MNETRRYPPPPRCAGVIRRLAWLWFVGAVGAADPGVARAEPAPAAAGLLVITADDAPASAARARWIESFKREGYAIQSVSLSRTNTHARVFTALAKMRVSLRDDALLVVIADVPARLSGLEGSETAVEWSSMPPSPHRPGVGMKMEVMESLVSWVAPPAGRLFIFSIQPAAAPGAGIEAASRAAFETSSHGPRRWWVWPAEHGGRTEIAPGGMPLFESCLSDADLPARLLRQDQTDDLIASIIRRVQALSGDRQRPLVWSANGTVAPASGDDLRKAIGVLAGTECDADAWLRQAAAAWSDGYPRVALGLAASAELLPGDAGLPFRVGLLRSNVRLAMGDTQLLHFELAGLAEHFERSRAEGVIRYEYSILRGEAEEAGGQFRDASAAYGEAWNVRMSLAHPPPALDIRLHTGLGRLASEEGRNEEARQRFEQAAKIADQLPDPERMWGARFAMDRAQWHARIGEWDAAQSWCNRAMEQAADYPALRDPLIKTVGDVAERMVVGGQIESASSLITQGRKYLLRPADPESAVWQRVQIRMDMASGRMNEAVEMMRRISPGARAGDAAWAELEVRMLVSEGQFAQAAEQCKNAIRLMRSQGADAGRIRALRVLQADGYLRGGQPERACSVCDLALGEADMTDAQRLEFLRLAIQALYRLGSAEKLARYAEAYLNLNVVPAASTEEAKWLLDAADAALHENRTTVALGMVRSAIFAAREAGVGDPVFWAKARETHALALPRRDPRAWTEALEALRILELCNRQISEDSARVNVLLSEVAREQGDLVRSRAYLSGVLTYLAVPNLVRDPGVISRARQADVLLRRGTQMPPPTGTPADHLRYESAATAAR